MKFILSEYHRNTTGIELIKDIKNAASKMKKDTATIKQKFSRTIGINYLLYMIK
jgi:hypothetical protein